MALDVFDQGSGSELLQDTFLFRNLNFSETQALSRLSHYERRKAGEWIIEEGSLGEALYLIQSGRVKVLKGEGAEVEELAELGPAELFGEMSLIEDALTSASVKAHTEVELLVIRRGDFEKLLADNEKLALKVYKSFCRTLSERLRRTSSQLGHLRLQDSARHEPTEPAARPAKPKPAAKAARPKTSKAKSRPARAKAKKGGRS